MRKVARRGLLCALVALTGCTASPGRIDQPIDATRIATLAGNRLPLLEGAHDEGRVESDAMLEGITLQFSLTPAQAADLAALLAQQQDRTSPNFHRWLTPAEYSERFGLSRGDLEKVLSWVQQEGFRVQRISPAGNELTVAGTVTQVESSFHTELHRYLVAGESHFAMAREPSVPVALAEVLVGLQGLDDFAPRPAYTLAGQHHVAPVDFATLYDVQPLYDAGFDGTNQTIAVIGDTFYTRSDITTFRSLTGLPAARLQDVFVPNSGDAGFINAGSIAEVEADLELAGAVAKNAQLTYVYTGGGNGFNVFTALKYAIDHNLAHIVSLSFGGCERFYTPALVTWLRTMADQANAQGMTLIGPSGDVGASGCDFTKPTVASQGLAVQLPASLPEFTCIGGTEFQEGAGTYWNASNDAFLGSVLSPIPEKAWNDSVATNSVNGGGGGVSTVTNFKPAWQVGPGVPNDGRRDVPDLSLAGSAIHDGYVVYMGPPAVGVAGLYGTWGGTSAGVPSFAGIVALLEQAGGSGALGNINPMLYTLAAQSPGAFRDITTGSNIVPCQPTTLDCPAVAPFQYGYSAGPGYDLATGLGSIDANLFVRAWLQCAATGCGPAKGQGAACLASGECASGFCVDGVCCNSACGGNVGTDCQACNVDAGAPASGSCAPVGAGQICRSASGSCENASVCNGVAVTCPAVTFKPSTTVCHSSAGACDGTARCTGSAASCPASLLAPGTVCRAASGACDDVETCSGLDVLCPVDAPKAAGTACAPASECLQAAACDGSGDGCPVQAPVANGTACLNGTGSCFSGACLIGSDAGVDAGTADGGAGDGGGEDSGVEDSGVEDSGVVDGGVLDGGALDGGAVDGGAADGGAADSGAEDAGAPYGGELPGPGVTATGCGCSTSAGPDFATALALALVVARRRFARVHRPR